MGKCAIWALGAFSFHEQRTKLGFMEIWLRFEFSFRMSIMAILTL